MRYYSDAIDSSFYAGDIFDRGVTTAYCCATADSAVNANNWSAQSLDNSISTCASGISSNVECRIDGLEEAIEKLSKSFENVKYSASDVGAALKKMSDKLTGSKKSLRSQLKTLGGNRRYV